MHALKDAQLIRQIALPAAGASASTDPINLTQAPPHECHFELELTLPALPSLADGKKVTVELEDSADGENFTPIAALAALVVTGAGGDGSPETIRRIRLPSDTRQHVRATAAVEAAGGDNTAKSFILAMVF